MAGSAGGRSSRRSTATSRSPSHTVTSTSADGAKGTGAAGSRRHRRDRLARRATRRHHSVDGQVLECDELAEDRRRRDRRADLLEQHGGLDPTETDAARVLGHGDAAPALVDHRGPEVAVPSGRRRRRLRATTVGALRPASSSLAASRSASWSSDSSKSIGRRSYRRHLTLLSTATTVGYGLTAVVDLRPTADQSRLRAECREWLRENLPWEYGAGLPPRFESLDEEVAFGREWQQQLAEGRWVGVTWPTEYGGRGAGAARRTTSSRRSWPGPGLPSWSAASGSTWSGPTLHGARHRRAEVPLAAPDPERRHHVLPAVQRARRGQRPRRAVDAGDARPTAAGCVNGQKVWTSYAQFADFGLCLARTNPEAPKKQAGISALVIDMRAAGVEVRPLKQITGESDFNEVFFDRRVRARRLRGRRGRTTAGGSRPRRSPTSAARTRDSSSSTRSTSRSCSASRWRAAGSTIRRTAQRLAEAYVEVRIFQLHNWRSLSRIEAGRPLGPEGSALKLYWSEMSQRLHAAGARRARSVGGAVARAPDDLPGDGEWQRSWLYYQSASIFAGTNEIQRNIIGERVLGLPRASSTATDVTGFLDGLRVLDLGTRIAAPFCAGLLGEHGAEVIKIEQPGAGDFMREIGPFVDTDEGRYSLFWAVEGRGRKSVTLDLRQAAGQDLLRRLAATADVVCENFRPGTLERWNVAPSDCDPRIVWVRISAFGQDGPNAKRPGLDRLGIGYGGLLNLTGYPDRPPVRPGVTTSDYLTGVFAAQAALAALYRRDAGPRATGTGAVVDAALYGSVLRILEWTIPAYDRLGTIRSREGNRLATSAPLDNYETADGKYVCLVAGSDTNFARLCRGDGPARADRRSAVLDPGRPCGALRRDQRPRQRLDALADRGGGRGCRDPPRRAGRDRLHRGRTSSPTST